MRSRIVGALVFLSILITLTWWRSERAARMFPKAAQYSQPVQQAPIQQPRIQQPAAPSSSDDDVKALVQQGVTAFRKMLKDNPDSNIGQCTNAADCTAKIPGLKIPPGVKMNLSVGMHGEIDGEAGRAGSGKSYYYYEGAATVSLQTKEAREWVAEEQPASGQDRVSRDEQVQAVLREAMAAYRKMVTEKPDTDVWVCYNAAECMAKIPGLKIPPGIRINMGWQPDAHVTGEAGWKGSGRSFQFEEGGDSMKQTKHEAYESFVQ